MNQAATEPSEHTVMRKVRSARNQKNQFIYDKLDASRRNALSKANIITSNYYAKVLRALEKYPLPILSALQATQLDGVGTKMAMIIGNLLVKRYEDMIENKDLISEVIDEEEFIPENGVLMRMNSQCSQLELYTQNNVANRNENKIIEEPISPVHSQKSVILVKKERDEDDVFQPKSALKRYRTLEDCQSENNDNNENEDDEENNSIVNLWPTYNEKENKKFKSLKKFQEKARKKKSKEYRPVSKTSSFNTLIGLYKFEAETKKKYASKREINQVLKKNQDDFGILKVSSWSCLPTLIKNGLISNFIFSNEEKYSLTESGYAVASECYLTKLQAQAQLESREIIPELGLLESLEPVTTKSRASNPIKMEKRRTSSSVFDLLKEDSNSNNSNPNPIVSSSLREIKTTNLDSNLDQLESSEPSPQVSRMLRDDSSSRKCRESTTTKDMESSASKTRESAPRMRVFNILKKSQSDELYMEETQKTKNKNNLSAHSKAVVVKNKIVSSFAAEDDNEDTVNFIKLEKLSCPKAEPEVKEITSPKGHEVKKNAIGSWEIVLYINNLELKNQKEKDYIYEKMIDNGITCKLSPLNLGDFLWTVEIDNVQGKNIYVLDYIIERSTADILAQKIAEELFDDEKTRLFDSKLKNIFYIVEGKATQKAPISQDEVDETLLEAQLSRNVKVRKSQSLQETIRMIAEMHIAIETKFMQDLSKPDPDSLQFKYKFGEYQNSTAKTKGPTVKYAFENMLKAMKEKLGGILDEPLMDLILDKYDNLHDFYHSLKLLDEDTNLIEFLETNSKSKGLGEMDSRSQEKNEREGVNEMMASKISDLFFSDSYQEAVSPHK